MRLPSGIRKAYPVTQWDFTAASLHRPRHHPHMSKASHHRIAAGSTLSLAGASRSHLPLDFNTTGGHFHAAPPRNEVPLLQPVLVRHTVKLHRTNQSLLIDLPVTPLRADEVSGRLESLKAILSQPSISLNRPSSPSHVQRSSSSGRDRLEGDKLSIGKGANGSEKAGPRNGICGIFENGKYR